MIMVHGDDKGLVIPPKVAHVQVVIVPIIQKDYDNKSLAAKAKEIGDKLKAAGIKVKVDDRDNYSPGWKYNHWELKGVPLRLEIGPKDVEKGEVRAVRRVDGQKSQLKWDGIAQSVS
jgi:prolyl-tRNA synthetase